VVPIIDRSASAELAFVALTRSKHAMDVVVPRTAFRDVEDLARHISERISLKTTTRNWSEVLDRTGGGETDRVRNIEAQREAESSPLRRQWQAEVVEPLRTLRAERMREERAEYARRKREGGEGLSLTEALERQRDLLRDFRGRAAVVTAETAPQKFGEWLREREATMDRVREGQREREHARQRERSAAHAPQPKRATIQRQEGSHERGHGARTEHER
jgi:hypothetical protein